MARDAAFTAFARRIAVLQTPKAPTWRYYFGHVAEGARTQQPGVGHGGEIPAVFGRSALCQCLGATPPAADTALYDDVQARWAAFALSGQPDVPGAPAWPRDGRLQSVAIVFDGHAQATPGFMRQRLDLFILAARVLAR